MKYDPDKLYVTADYRKNAFKEYNEAMKQLHEAYLDDKEGISNGERRDSRVFVRGESDRTIAIRDKAADISHRIDRMVVVGAESSVFIDELNVSVTVEETDIKTNATRVVTYNIVPVGAADPKNSIYPYTAPRVNPLIGKKAGDVVKVTIGSLPRITRLMMRVMSVKRFVPQR